MPELFLHGHALLIGVGRDLPTTVKDATALRDILVDPHRAAYPPNQVTMLVESAAERQNILNAFDRLISKVIADEQATVIVYFSGHGGRFERDGQPIEYGLIPHDYDPGDRNGTTISAAMFTDKIEAIKAQKLVVLLDCCHAAGMPAIKAAGETFVKSPVDLLNMLGVGSGRVIITSSREQELSYIGDTYSIFTACLLDALAGKASMSKDSYARIIDILGYLFDQVPKRAAPYIQHPFVKQILDLDNNFPLCYYAGGSKSVPGETPIADFPSVSTGLTAGQRLRLQQKLEGLQQEWRLRNEIIKRMHAALSIEAGIKVKFQLEQEFLQETAARDQVEREIERIERVLE
ncbi:MAG: caspase family protein [Kouleothrix sp.]|nr:caspase family protein [Kouleothrix sp.]